MKKNKTLFGGRLSFVILLSLFFAAGLYAQETGEAGELNGEEQESVSEISVTQERFDAEISSIRDSVNLLQDSLRKIQLRFDDISKKNSQSQIWQIFLSVSVVLISVTFLAFFVLLLLKILKFHTVVVNAPKSEFDGKLQREHPTIEESRRSTYAEISPAEFREIKNKLNDMQYQLKDLAEKLNAQSKDVTARFNSDLSPLRSEMTDFKQKLKNSEEAFSSLKADMDKNREKLARKERTESDPVAAFNQWSQNPRQALPQYFTYVANVKPEFRIKQEFVDTGTETDWVRNTVGEKKFLFPNPNTIDRLSGPVDKLYKVTGTRKGRGANSVKVTNACQIKEGNFIEYQGELMLM